MEPVPKCSISKRYILLVACLLVTAFLFFIYSVQQSTVNDPNTPPGYPSRNSFTPISDNLAPVKAKIEKNSDRPCTFKLFREYLADYGYFPAGGQWNMARAPNNYQPGFCKFKYPKIPQSVVAKCLADSDISSVTTIGDSNAMRYFSTVKAYIGNCAKKRTEAIKGGGFIPDAAYYKSVNRSDIEWEQELETHERHCGGCASEVNECTVSAGEGQPRKSITAEHLAMTMIVDDSLQVRFPLRRKTVHSLDNLWAVTTQETLFRYYMKGRFPDVLIVYFPSNHAKHLGMERLRIDMEYFKSLVHLYIPKTTKIFYFATFGEFESKRQGKQWINATFENMLAAEKIDKMNHLMADVLRDDFLNTSQNAYPFLDLVSVSRTLVDWSIDGVHMSGKWYYAAMSMFWETFCNSVNLNAF